MDCSLPGSSVHGIFQARILDWVAISFSRGSSQPRDGTWVSRTIGRCFTVWATREVLSLVSGHQVGSGNVNTGVCACVCVCTLSDVWLLATPRTVDHQSPLFVGFSRWKHRSGLPFPTPGDLPDPGIKPASPAMAGRFFTTVPRGKPKALNYLSPNEPTFQCTHFKKKKLFIWLCQVLVSAWEFVSCGIQDFYLGPTNC